MKFPCPHCKRNISVTPADYGTQTICPHPGCRESIRVPFAEAFAKQPQTQQEPPPASRPHPLQEKPAPPPEPVSTAPADEPHFPETVAAPRSKRAQIRLINDFRSKSDQFLDSEHLDMWELAALKSFQLKRKVDRVITVILSLLAVNLLFRVLLIVAKSSGHLANAPAMDLAGLIAIPLLAVVAKVRTHVVTVVLLAVSIFVFAPGIISAAFALALLYTVPILIKASKLINLLGKDRKLIRWRLGVIASGEDPGYFLAGNIAGTAVWASRYENQVVFVSGKSVLNLIPIAHLSQLEFKNNILFKWPNENGKLVPAKLELSKRGFRELREWSRE